MSFYIAGSRKLITEEQRNRIEGNRVNIIKYLHIEESLLSVLQAHKILSSEQASLIRCCVLDEHKNTMLLDYVLKLSEEKLNIFLGILDKSNQAHVSQLFRYCEGKALIVFGISNEYPKKRPRFKNQVSQKVLIGGALIW